MVLVTTMCPDIIFKTSIDVKIGTEITDVLILARFLWDIIGAIQKIIKQTIRLFILGVLLPLTFCA